MMYSTLWVVVISAILGMFLGIYIMHTALNWAMRCGTIDLYVKGYKLEKLTMWGK